MSVRGIGTVVETRGRMLIARLPLAHVGAGVRIVTRSGRELEGRVVGLTREGAAIAPFGDLDGVARGDRIAIDRSTLRVVLGYAALGRALDGAGKPLDGRAPRAGWSYRVDAVSPRPDERTPIVRPFWTGVRAIDGLLTFGRGARIGLFGAPGAGKSTLLEAIARAPDGDAVVVALVGERGREAAGWLRRLDARTTIVCATGDRSAAERARAAELAMAQAVVLRERGLHVVLIVDSLARYAAALRELRVAAGEPVGRGGYPASVFADLVRLLERAGNGHDGSVTTVATVLVDGSDEREPVAEAARATLDGHVVLSGDLARRGHFPAIDVLASASRTMSAVVEGEHAEAAGRIRRALALLEETRDLRLVGLAPQEDAELALAVRAQAEIGNFLAQRLELASSRDETRAELLRLSARLSALSGAE